jgi:hypothetical protein
MTTKEAKELELFKEWWNIEKPFHEYSFEKDIAEMSWIARSKLDKDKDEETNL